MAGDDAWACGSCAAPNAPANRFCVTCGAPHPGVAAAPPWPSAPPTAPPPPATPAFVAGGPQTAPGGHVPASPTPAPAPPRGPRRTVLLVAALALVAIVAGVGLGLALTRGDTSADEVATEDGPTDDVTASSAASPPPTIGDGPAPSSGSGPSPTTPSPTRPSPTPTAPATTPATTPPPAPAPTAPARTGGPFPLGSWVAVRVSLRSEGEAIAYRDASSPGGTILATDDYPSLTPGYWIVAYGPYASAEEAVGQCRSAGFTDRDDCFGAPLTSSSADRDQRAYPD